MTGLEASPSVAVLTKSTSISSQVPTRAEPPLIGRSVELNRLSEALSLALTGQRQVVFITGEAGDWQNNIAPVICWADRSDIAGLDESGPLY